MNKKPIVIIAIATIAFSYFALRFALYGNVQGRVVYYAMRSGTYSYLYVTNAFGFPKHRLSDKMDWDVSPAWSPDNQKIAYECQSPIPDSSVRGICVINVDGTDRKQVTFVDTGRHMNPVWSPDGQQIAFEWGSDIFIVQFSDLSVTQLTKTPETDWEPSWSPDSNKIAFASERDGNWEIYSMNADGSNQINLTQNDSHDYNPTWSKDGNFIFFISDRLGNDEIFRLSVSTQEIVNLTNNPEDDYFSATSPDGTKIAFTRASDIFVMNLDGTQQKRLTSFKGYDGQPTWSPDGKNIAFIFG
jgi:TolB protein